MKTLDARSWVVWLLMGGFLTMSVGNPIYLLLLLLISRLVQFAFMPMESGGWRLPFWRVSLMIITFSTLFNLLTSHIGQTVLFSLPNELPLIGGFLTIEAAMFGLISGIRLVTLLSFFLAFNTVVPTSDLADLTPKALHELGLVTLIALTYVPETARQFQRIRDAQAIRGHQFNGLRAWRPILIPLLIAGMERALSLSETIVARGYGSTTHLAMPFRIRLALVLGLLLTLGGALRLAWSESDGWLLLIAGVVAVGLAYRDLNQQVFRTRLRPRQWNLNETLVVVGAVVPLLHFLPIHAFDHSVLIYSPYPKAGFPPFDLWVGLSILGLAIPLLLVALPVRQLEASS